jgi:hypothetical protein
LLSPGLDGNVSPTFSVAPGVGASPGGVDFCMKAFWVEADRRAITKSAMYKCELTNAGFKCEVNFLITFLHRTFYRWFATDDWA